LAMTSEAPIKEWDLWGCNRTFNRLHYRERERTGGLGFDEDGLVDDTRTGTRPSDEYTVNGFRFRFGDSVRDEEKGPPRRKVCTEIAVRTSESWQVIYGEKKNWMGEEAYGALSRKESLTWAQCREAIKLLRNHLRAKGRMTKNAVGQDALELAADAALQSQPVVEESMTV
jgi:hypothetical protein